MPSLSRKHTFSILRDLRDYESRCRQRWWTLDQIKGIIYHIYDINDDVAVTTKALSKVIHVLSTNSDETTHRYRQKKIQWSTTDGKCKRITREKVIVCITGSDESPPPTPREMYQNKDFIDELGNIPMTILGCKNNNQSSHLHP